MSFFDAFSDNIIVFDGAMGTELQKKGLAAGAMPEQMNFDDPDAVISVHRGYIEAGAQVISTNSFGANAIKLRGSGLDAAETVGKAVALAREAVASSGKRVLVAADLGPTGRMFPPAGDMTFEEAAEAFGVSAEAAWKAGADFIFFETMSDLYECKAAVIGAREKTPLPVAVSVTFDETGHTLTGADPECACVYLCSLGVDAIGINCGLGPDAMQSFAQKLISMSGVPVIVNANAGLPVIENGKTVYKTDAKRFFDFAETLAGYGVSAVGGCCGTTDAHISAVAEALKGKKRKPIKSFSASAVCSGSRTYFFGKKVCVIGERLNPTGKPKLKEALRNGSTDYICREAAEQLLSGADLLDVNTGLPGIDEAKTLCSTVRAVQSAADAPLVLDSALNEALNKAIREYNGITVINSVNGKEESMKSIFPLAKKYGGMIICLLLDENGIPGTAEGRLAIAERIIARASDFGIGKERLLFDALTMTVATDRRNGETTLECVKKLSGRGLLTVLGVSNISFGLPDRERINAAFLGAAINRGLSAAIINPSSECAKTVIADPGGIREFVLTEADFGASENSNRPVRELTLSEAVLNGISGAAAELTQKLLLTESPLSVVEKVLIPALNELGDGYEKKKIFLPRLLGGAAAAKAAFAVINGAMKGGDARENGMRIVIATVKGDIHDIGKNIVSTLLSNYGFSVTDLGKDVPPERVLSAVRETGARLVSLSALMTTTVPAMATTVALLKKEAPDCRVMVGGAVLTKEYASDMGADFYGPDAVSAVRYAEKVRDSAE